MSTVELKTMANAIRALAMDAVENAKSGHPGLPLGMADVATVLFTKSLKFDPQHPDWPDRDRFVLSAGHGSMLLYAALFLLGYPGLSIKELRGFRQWGSATPGHPEFSHTPGVETTTGPLGQGFANAVGMALAERVLAARFGSDLVDHRTYVLASDGDLMEGISHEAASLAGHLRLNKLIVLFDDNGITIDGALSLTESGNQLARFAAYGWATARVDGHDPAAIEAAIGAAQRSDRPSLIACRTVIGYGAPNKQGTAATHGSPLGADEVAAARTELGWSEPPFQIPDTIVDAWRAAGSRGTQAYDGWTARLAMADAATRTEYERRLAGRLPSELSATLRAHIDALIAAPPTLATRKASEAVLKVINPLLPEAIGGSADLTPSNCVKTSDQAVIEAGAYDGRYIHYGIREHAMAAAMNGLALHGGFRPYGATFLVFTDYCRPAIRLAALMGLPVIYVMSHDSIGVGEDGPTHQPVEHLAALRAIPNLNVFRPADAVETAECWQLALESRGRPSVIVLTRQDVPALRTEKARDNPYENRCARGGYEISGCSLPSPEVTLLATGSEVALAVEAQQRLERAGIGTRVVSLPCWSLFDALPAKDRERVLGEGTVRVAVEAACGLGWERYTASPDGFVGMTGFGASAPYQVLYEQFGITPEAVAAKARALLGDKSKGDT